MSSILFCTNLPSPYRVDFFNELGKFCNLTVCYERKTASDRDKKWISSQAVTYKEVYLDLKPVGTDTSRGSALRKYIAAHPCDILIMTGYVSPACMEAIAYCRIKRIPYWIEYDGGFNKSESLPKRLLKKFLLGHAVGHLTTSDEHIAYLRALDIPPERIHKYPFTSVSQAETLQVPPTPEEKADLREKLHLSEEKVVVSVGRFNYQEGEGKGFDLLFRIAEELRDVSFYIIGDEPTDRFVNWKREKNLSNMHFIPFKVRKDLFEYYRAADMMVLLTRGDVWGLVVNESMANGLPVITTDRCIAGLEMVRNGVNGYIVPADDWHEALERINTFFADKTNDRFGEKCLETARRYTIERMAQRHMEILSDIQKGDTE